jgi:hypothetical protein
MAALLSRMQLRQNLRKDRGLGAHKAFQIEGVGQRGCLLTKAAEKAFSKRIARKADRRG